MTAGPGGTPDEPVIRFPDAPKLELDQLIDQLVDRAQDVKRAQDRLRALLRATEMVTGDLSLETVLRNVVDAACALADARYGAVAVLGPQRTLEQFIHVGMPDEVAARIGQPPQGLGLLGALINDPRPIRLRRLSDDPRSVGFPPGHPPMTSFLGVPIYVRGGVFGNLYLAESRQGEFSAEDEELVVALAIAAGGAVSNARLYDESRQQQRWLGASVEVGSQLASGGTDQLGLIASRVIECADADLVAVTLVTDDDAQLFVEEASGAGAADIVGRTFVLDETVSGLVVRGGEPLLVSPEDLARSSRGDFVRSLLPAGPVMILPLTGSSGVRGVLTVVRRVGRPRFTATDLALSAGFASHASVALELSDSRSAEQRLMLLEDRDRIARDLHDHVIQELFAIGLGLEQVASGPSVGDIDSKRIRQRVDDIDGTIRRIRTTIFELRGSLAPGELQIAGQIRAISHDMIAALGFVPRVLTSDLHRIHGDGRLKDDILAVVREGLSNVARHAHATSATVTAEVSEEAITVTVLDDGTGPGESERRSGTANLQRRAEARRGTCTLLPGEEHGSVLTWSVPRG